MNLKDINKIKDPKIKRELRYLFLKYIELKKKNLKPSVIDLLIIEFEKAMKAKKHKTAKSHLLTLGIKEQYLNDYIEGRKQLRKVN
jgi:hypothetical protein